MNYIDLTSLQKTWKNDNEKVRKYVFLFFDVLKRDLQDIIKYLDQGEFEIIHEIGHRAKSAARTLGAEGYAMLCERLENIDNLADSNYIVEEMKSLLIEIEHSISASYAE